MRSFIRFFLLVAATGAPVSAQEHTPDANTLLLLHFNNTLTGAQGEIPTQATGVTYEAGIFGNGAHFGTGNQVYYASANNILAAVGTLEFWIKPKWNGGDGQGYVVLRWAIGGGMLFFKDGGNYWRSLFNRFGDGGNPEVGTGINISAEWQANVWHHCAFTWDSDSLKLYVDGTLRTASRVTSPLSTIAETTFQLGGENFNFYLNAVLDELRLSNIERSPAEIRASYLAGISVSGLTIQPDQIELLETWRITPKLLASTNMGTMNLPPSAAQWSSDDPGVATVDAAGRITAIAAGQASVTASYQGVQAQTRVNVNAPVLPPQIEPIAPYLATPAPGHLFEIPVVIFRYLPTLDGVNVDPTVADWHSSLADLKSKIDRDAIQTKFMLEEGSRFRGYQNPSAVPALGYRVVHFVTVYEELPPGFEIPGSPGFYFPDYDQILTRFDAENFVNTLGVKEFWLWGYHHGKIVPVESNMSSPTTGDISNSFRFNDDMPVFNRTYTLYNYNFTRGPNENVHNHGHQLEAILSHANFLQAGNTDLFWKKFVGQNASGNFITGRCGWTHMPPNTTQHYDYDNTNLAESDIADWTPERTGAKTLVNAGTWGNIAYAWPNGDPPAGQTEAQWYIYWMQNMPGLNNRIPYGSEVMTNWWEFTADWDASITSKKGLYGPPVSTVTVPFNFPAQNGAWYLISLPVLPEDFSVNNLFPSAAGAFEWNFATQRYQQVTDLAPGKAYWLLMLQAATVQVTGLPLGTYSRNYTAPGWDLIGSVQQLGALTDNPAGSVLAIFGWNALTQTYFQADPSHIEPAQGYWILVFGVPSTVTIGSSGRHVAKMNTAPEAFYAKYGALPPPPPFALADKQLKSLPKSFGLSQNYPNPFWSEATSPAFGRGNPETVIEYQLPEAGRVSLKIYDLVGREVRTLVDAEKPAGYHRVKWDGRDGASQNLKSGIYLCRLKIGGFAQTRKVVLVR
jgi:hypothetical protein